MAESFQRSGPGVDPDHPWLGLRPFTEETRDYFFGRTSEIGDIFERVPQNALTILYGQSGLGKTSLLRAGLLPKLRNANFRPTHILLDFSENAPPLIVQVREKLAAALSDDGDVTPLLERWKPLGSLWEIFAHEELRPADLDEKPPILLFDQFEEIFTLGADEKAAPTTSPRRHEVRELFTQLSDLVENRPPASLQDRFRTDRRRARSYVFGPINAHVVLTLREDYLSQLEDWKGQLPALMRNRMRLRLLSGPQALQAVVQPGRMNGHSLISAEVGEQIVRFVAQREPDTPLEEIEAVPPLVSLLCERLNEARLAAKPPLTGITADLVEQQGKDILQTFYDKSFAGFDRNDREAIRAWVEDRLVTTGGYRNPAAREDALAELNGKGVADPASALDSLIARRLLTAEKRGGTQRLEITHDVLCPLVVRARTARMERLAAEEKAQENRLAAEEARRRELEAEAEAKKERDRQKQLRRWLFAASAFALMALVSGLFALMQMRRADAAARQAEEALKDAKEQLIRAQTEEGRAWIERSKLNLNRGNPFAAAFMAGRAVGFVGLGRAMIKNEPFLKALPILLTPTSAAKDEAEARQWIEKAVTDDQFGLPLWQSPVVNKHRDPVSTVAWSPDGRTLASGSEDRTVKLWEAATGKLLNSLKGHTDDVSSVAWSPDGRTLASGSSDGRVKLWEAATGKLLNSLKGHTDRVSSVAWSPDGRTLASGSSDRTVKRWEAVTYRKLDLAEYIRGGWFELRSSELEWQVPSDNLFQERNFPVLNVPPNTLMGVYSKDPGNADTSAEVMRLLLRADNFPAAAALWSAHARKASADALVRRIFLAAGCARAADDLESKLGWRGLWLTAQLTPAFTPESFADPAVSLGALRLATVLSTSREANPQFATTRDALLERLREVAPPEWQQAFAERIKNAQEIE